MTLIERYYAGIGSRETPNDVLLVMKQLATKLSGMDYVLRSGGARGADTAFESGSKRSVIYLPWSGFNDLREDGITYIVPPINEDMVGKYHPAPDKLSQAGTKLMSRNTYQVLGPELRNPVDFVICWTKDGKDSGGTGQANRIARDNGIPVYNLKNVEDRMKLITGVMSGP